MGLTPGLRILTVRGSRHDNRHDNRPGAHKPHPVTRRIRKAITGNGSIRMARYCG